MKKLTSSQYKVITDRLFFTAQKKFQMNFICKYSPIKTAVIFRCFVSYMISYYDNANLSYLSIERQSYMIKTVS